MVRLKLTVNFARCAEMATRIQTVLHTATNLSRITLKTGAELNRHLIHGGLACNLEGL